MPTCYMSKKLWPISYSNLLSKMGHYFLDTQYVQKGAGPTTTEKKRVFLETQRYLEDSGRITNKSK